MKNSIFYVLVVALIFTSCKEVHDETHKKEQPVKDLEEKIVQEKDTTCFSSYNIYPATAWIWSESYVSYENQKSKKLGAFQSSDMITSPVVFFSNDSLSKLKSQIASSTAEESSKGVILYYIMADKNDTAPSLAMANTVNCLLPNLVLKNKVCKDCVLVSWSAGNGKDAEHGFISWDELHKYRLIWEEFMTDIQDEGFTKVNGYNYAWATIDNIMSTNDDLAVKYGLKTLEPSDSRNYDDSNGDGKTGSVVICNVLIGTTDLLEDNTFVNYATLEDLDFAKPCPDYCGGEQQ